MTGHQRPAVSLPRQPEHRFAQLGRKARSRGSRHVPFDLADPRLDLGLAEQPVEAQKRDLGPDPFGQPREVGVVADDVDLTAVLVDGEGETYVGHRDADVSEAEFALEHARVGDPRRAVLPRAVGERSCGQPASGDSTQFRLAGRRNHERVLRGLTWRQLKLKTGVNGIDKFAELGGVPRRIGAADRQRELVPEHCPPRPERLDGVRRGLALALEQRHDGRV
ncbi:hypothetical protein [Micromonospora sp. NPDC000729]|uniref:hypothetical protein n=1 Tax=Micromonospora sp. NPDC000729 TaxID=3364220 RepID=UPI0036857E59